MAQTLRPRAAASSANSSTPPTRAWATEQQPYSRYRSGRKNAASATCPDDPNYDLYKLGLQGDGTPLLPQLRQSRRHIQSATTSGTPTTPSAISTKSPRWAAAPASSRDRYGEKTSIGRGNLSPSPPSISVRLAIECMNIQRQNRAHRPLLHQARRSCSKSPPVSSDDRYQLPENGARQAVPAADVEAMERERQTASPPTRSSLSSTTAPSASASSDWQNASSPCSANITAKTKRHSVSACAIVIAHAQPRQ